MADFVTLCFPFEFEVHGSEPVRADWYLNNLGTLSSFSEVNRLADDIFMVLRLCLPLFQLIQHQLNITEPDSGHIIPNPFLPWLHKMMYAMSRALLVISLSTRTGPLQP